MPQNKKKLDEVSEKKERETEKYWALINCYNGVIEFGIKIGGLWISVERLDTYEQSPKFQWII